MKCPFCNSLDQRWYQLDDPIERWVINALVCLVCRKIIDQKAGMKPKPVADQKEMFE